MKPAILFLFFCIAFPVLLLAQQPDTTGIKKDTVVSQAPLSAAERYNATLTAVLSEDSLLNSKGNPESLAVKNKKRGNKDSLFYLLTALLLVLALLRFFFARYFTNLFRVFFNTSLRQSQLTDQLLQAKLPSLLFNVFFVISSGLYSYFLLVHYQWIKTQNSWIMMASCTGLVGIVYTCKFSILKFTGWVTGFREETNTYVFVLFLINKIIGIFLVPFIILMAFSDSYLVKTAVLISLLIIGFLLLLRFFRSYGLLQNQLKVSRFHFFIYIIGIEILPLLLIYKGLVIFLNKNL